MENRRWVGGMPAECDLQRHEIVQDNDHPHSLAEGFVDGATKWGPWANMCLTCHKRYGNGLGLGRGQKYDANGLKVEG